MFDHHYVFPKTNPDLLPAQFKAAEAMGMRMAVSRGSMDRSQKDGGLPPDSVVQTIDDILRNSEDIVGDYHDPKPFAMRPGGVRPLLAVLRHRGSRKSANTPAGARPPCSAPEVKSLRTDSVA